MRGIWIALLLSSWLMMLPASAAPWEWLPGSQMAVDAPFTYNYHWLVHTRGLLGVTHTRNLLSPYGQDRLLTQGFPGDAVASYVFLKILGWPAGFTVFMIFMLWAAGAAAAWLAGRWWRSRVAALFAGVTFQSSTLLLWEITDGHISQVVASIFIPLSLGVMALCLFSRGWRSAAIAGALAGLSVLTYWFAGVFILLGWGVLFFLALCEGRLPWRPFLIAGLAALAVTGLPMIYTVTGIEAMPGIDIDKWGNFAIGQSDFTLAQWISQYNGLNSSNSQGWLHGFRPLIVALMALAILGARARYWLAPAAWLAVALLFAIGPWLDLVGGVSLPGPFLAMMDLPLLSRLWWPYRFLWLGILGIAVLAGGGAARLQRVLLRWSRPGNTAGGRTSTPRTGWRHRLRRVVPALMASLLLLLLVEAYLLNPYLPLAATPGKSPKTSQVLAQRKGLTLILPFGGGPLRRNKDMMMLYDQIFHGRPLLNNDLYPRDSNSPLSRKALVWPVLNYLSTCEMNAHDPVTPAQQQALSRLYELGLKEVYLELRYVRSKKYIDCIQALLGDATKDQGPFRVYFLRPRTGRHAAARSPVRSGGEEGQGQGGES